MLEVEVGVVILPEVVEDGVASQESVVPGRDVPRKVDDVIVVGNGVDLGAQIKSSM